MGSPGKGTPYFSSEGLGSQRRLLHKASWEVCLSSLLSPFSSPPVPPPPDLLSEALKYSGFTEAYRVLFLQWGMRGQAGRVLREGEARSEDKDEGIARRREKRPHALP